MIQYNKNDSKYFSDRKKSFDVAAYNYDKYRPSYPREVFDFLVKVTDLKKDVKVLEIGCGSGQATSSLLRLGFNVHAIDISSGMISILRKKNKNKMNLIAQVIAFEEFELKSETFDLIFSSQAKHWIDKYILYPKTAKLLKNSGYICWVSNNIIYPGKVVRLRLDQLYKKYFPIMTKRDGGPLGNEYDYAIKIKKEISQSGLFKEAQVKKILWEKEYTVDQYIGLLKTQSDHILQGEKINKLYDGIRKIIQDVGGMLPIKYEACIALAQKN